MTVGELIEKLSHIPGNLEVVDNGRIDFEDVRIGVREVNRDETEDCCILD